MTLRALIPLKPLSLAKSRLAERLSADERRALALSMARHVIAVVSGEVDETILLVGEPMAEFSGLRVMIDAGDGLNASIACAAAALNARPGDGLLVVFADLPLIAADEVRALIAASAEGLALAPDRLGVGTNAVGFRQPLDLTFQFGPDSFGRFQAEARRLGLPAVAVERPGLGLDIDDEESLALYVGEAGLAATSPLRSRTRPAHSPPAPPPDAPG